jgi:hypothetical protein
MFACPVRRLHLSLTFAQANASNMGKPRNRTFTSITHGLCLKNAFIFALPRFVYYVTREAMPASRKHCSTCSISTSLRRNKPAANAAYTFVCPNKLLGFSCKFTLSPCFIFMPQPPPKVVHQSTLRAVQNANESAGVARVSPARLRVVMG